ncbi:hypothetical protein FACS1894204_00640 [Synergistales bacterium]|nr:hypothetical protein FACS1894204_00640 [Synergistales bacterium]
MRPTIYAAAIIAAVVIMAALVKRGERFGKKRAFMMALASAFFFASVFAGANVFFALLENIWPGRLYAAEIISDVPALRVAANETAKLQLEVKNTGSLTWDSLSDNKPVFLSWHILDSRGNTIRFDNARISFGKTIMPGDSEVVAVQITPSSYGISTGRYIFEFDVIQENVTWFADRGSMTRRVPVEVTP